MSYWSEGFSASVETLESQGNQLGVASAGEIQGQHRGQHVTAFLALLANLGSLNHAIAAQGAGCQWAGQGSNL